MPSFQLLLELPNGGGRRGFKDNHLPTHLPHRHPKDLHGSPNLKNCPDGTSMPFCDLPRMSSLKDLLKLLSKQVRFWNQKPSAVYFSPVSMAKKCIPSWQNRQNQQSVPFQAQTASTDLPKKQLISHSFGFIPSANFPSKLTEAAPAAAAPNNMGDLNALRLCRNDVTRLVALLGGLNT